MTYGTQYKAIYQALIDTIVATTTFTTTNTTGNYIKDWTGITYPTCMVRPMKDRLVTTELSGALEQREARFKIIIKNTGTGTKTDQDTIIDYVGEIIDQIKSSRNLGLSSVSAEASDEDIDYSLSTDRSAIFYYAIIIVRVNYVRATS